MPDFETRLVALEQRLRDAEDRLAIYQLIARCARHWAGASSTASTVCLTEPPGRARSSRAACSPIPSRRKHETRPSPRVRRPLACRPSGAVAAPTAFAAFPDKQLKLVVPYSPGGLGDRSARLIADSLEEQWKQPVEVDKLADIAPVSIIVRFPFALITSPSVAAGSVAELIDHAKKNPGKVNFAIFGPSSSSNFLAHAFAAQHGLNIATVPYIGTSQVKPDLMSGVVHVFFYAVAPSVPLYRDKKLKILRVNSTERLPLAAEIPTMAKQGFPFRYESWFGICTTAGTPPDVMAQLSDSVRKAVASDEFQKRMKDAGTVPVSSPSPEECSRFMKDEIDRWGSVIRPLNIKVD